MYTLAHSILMHIGPLKEYGYAGKCNHINSYLAIKEMHN